MFGRKSSSNDVSLDVKSEHKLSSFSNISSIFKGNSDESIIESIIETEIESHVIEEPYLALETDAVKPSTSKAVKLIQEVQKLEDRTIKPFVDYNEGLLFYPILSQIGEMQDNVSCLDDLVSDGVLEK